MPTCQVVPLGPLRGTGSEIENSSVLYRHEQASSGRRSALLPLLLLPVQGSDERGWVCGCGPLLGLRANGGRGCLHLRLLPSNHSVSNHLQEKQFVSCLGRQSPPS
jgi:hypothetical protein